MSGFTGARGGRGRFGGERKSFGGERQSFGGERKSFGGPRRGGFGGARSAAPRYHAICSQCGEDCMVPFKPLGDKPVLCDNCFKSAGAETRPETRRRHLIAGAFGRGSEDNSRPAPDYKGELVELSAKLDRIIFLLEKLLPPEPKAPKSTTKSATKSPTKTTTKKKAS